jgi:hypothetical protein
MKRDFLKKYSADLYEGVYYNWFKQHLLEKNE